MKNSRLVASLAVGVLLSIPSFCQDAAIRGSILNGNPKIGLSVGDTAPRFKARDQFGNEQTNETLKRKNGTVILFFRSADW